MKSLGVKPAANASHPCRMPEKQGESAEAPFRRSFHFRPILSCTAGDST